VSVNWIVTEYGPEPLHPEPLPRYFSESLSTESAISEAADPARTSLLIALLVKLLAPIAPARLLHRHQRTVVAVLQGVENRLKRIDQQRQGIQPLATVHRRHTDGIQFCA